MDILRCLDYFCNNLSRFRLDCKQDKPLSWHSSSSRWLQENKECLYILKQGKMFFILLNMVWNCMLNNPCLYFHILPLDPSRFRRSDLQHNIRQLFFQLGRQDILRSKHSNMGHYLSKRQENQDQGNQDHSSTIGLKLFSIVFYPKLSPVNRKNIMKRILWAGSQFC